MNQNELKAARNSTTVLAALVSTLAHTVHEGKSWVDLHELRRQFSSPENVLCRIYQHLWRVQSIFEGGSKRSCVYMPSLSVRFTQPSHYRTDELACRCRIFPTASPIIKIFSSCSAPCLVLLECRSRYGTTCVPGAKTDVEVRTRTGSAIYGQQ